MTDMHVALIGGLVFLIWVYHVGWVSGAFKMVYLEEIEKLTTKKRVLLVFLIAFVPFSLPLKLFAEKNLSKKMDNEDRP